MRDMFYNYDHKVDLIPDCYQNINKQELAHNTAVKPLFNIKNQLIGVEASENADIPLIFNFDLVCFPRELIETGKLFLDILNFKYEPVMSSLAVTLDKDSNTSKVIVHSSDKGPLKCGTYYMHLYILLNDTDDNEVKYTLFSTKDGILKIN